LERIQDEGKSKARRARIFAAGKVEVIAEGTESGRTAQFAVEIQQYRNQVEFLERTVADQKVELETLKQLAGEQATELHTLRRASSSYVGTSRTTALSVLCQGSSPYLNKPKSCQPWRKHAASAAATAETLGNAASRSSTGAGRGTSHST
jgi:hypothetical protein